MLRFEKQRLDHIYETQGLTALVDTVKSNYGIYIRWVKNTKNHKSLCTRRSIITSIVYYRNLLKSWDQPFGAGTYA